MNTVDLKLDFNERADKLPEWLGEFQLQVKDLWQYPNRQALEAKMAQDLTLDAGHLMLTNGGDESIELLYKLSKLDDMPLLIPEPCFSQYTHNQGVWQNEVTFVPTQADLSIDTAAVKAQIESGQCVILTRPNNPTGEFLADDVLRNLIETAAVKGAWVFLDEAYVEFAEQSDVNYYSEYDNVICLRTFSKAFGLAGVRVGYILGNEQLIGRIRRLAMPFNVSQANLQIAAQAWEQRNSVSAYCQQIRKNRALVSDYLAAQGLFVCPAQGNFLLFRVSNQQKTLIANVLKKQGIQIKTALGGLPDCLRMTIPYQVESVMTALKQIFEPAAVAFDMDGVLIDTSLSYDLAIVDTVESFTGQAVTIDQIVSKRSQGGYNNDWVLAQAMIEDLGQVEDLQKVTDVFQAFYLGTEAQRGRFKDEVNLLRGESPLFDTSKKRAVVTGRPRFEAKQGVSQLGIKPAFVVSLDDVKNGKPDPEGILWLQKQWQLTDSDGMYFCGDNVDDMQAGNAAQCICVGISGGSEQQQKVLYQAGADVVLENINQLEALFS